MLQPFFIDRFAFEATDAGHQAILAHPANLGHRAWFAQHDPRRELLGSLVVLVDRIKQLADLSNQLSYRGIFFQHGDQPLQGELPRPSPAVFHGLAIGQSPRYTHIRTGHRADLLLQLS